MSLNFELAVFFIFPVSSIYLDFLLHLEQKLCIDVKLKAWWWSCNMLCPTEC